MKNPFDENMQKASILMAFSLGFIFILWILTMVLDFANTIWQANFDEKRAADTSIAEIDSVNYELIIGSNGDIEVVETINFADSMLGETYNRIWEIENINIDNIKLSYGRNDEIQTYEKDEILLERHKYVHASDNSKNCIKWIVEETDDSYTLIYTLQGSIVRGKKYAVLNFPCFKEDNSLKAEEVTGIIRLPDNISIYGEADASVRLKGYKIDWNRFLKGTRFKVVGALGRETELNIKVSIDSNKFEGYLPISEDASFTSNVSEYWILFAIYAVGVIVFVKTLISDYIGYKRLQKLKTTTTNFEYVREVPNPQISPLTAFFLIENSYNYISPKGFANVFAGLLMNLKKKGALKFEYSKNEISKTGLSIVIEKTFDIDLIEEEKETLDFLIEVYKEYNALTPELIELYMCRNYSRTRALKESYVRINKEFMKERNYYAGRPIETKYLEKGMGYHILMFVEIMLITPLFGTALGNVDLGFGIFMATMILPIIEQVISGLICQKAERLTLTGKEEREKWRAFKRYLEDYSMMEYRNIDELELWEDYLMYATAMGVAKKTSDTLDFDTSDLNINVAYNTSDEYRIEYINQYVNMYRDAINNAELKSTTAFDRWLERYKANKGE